MVRWCAPSESEADAVRLFLEIGVEKYESHRVEIHRSAHFFMLAYTFPRLLHIARCVYIIDSENGMLAAKGLRRLEISHQAVARMVGVDKNEVQRPVGAPLG